MELKTAIEILEYHQEWRLGKREYMIHQPKKLTEALDIVLSEVKKLNYTTCCNNLEEVMKKAKPNLDKIKDADQHLDGIR